MKNDFERSQTDLADRASALDVLLVNGASRNNDYIFNYKYTIDIILSKCLGKTQKILKIFKCF